MILAVSLHHNYPGAKLISPFGLLGQLSTKGFKGRLHEQYHRLEPAPGLHRRDLSETIRMEEFLRDFIIDLGPADIENKPRQFQAEAKPITVVRSASC